MKWISIEDQKPPLEDCGKDFLVAVKFSSGYGYEVCEWYNPECDNRKPYFNIKPNNYHTSEVKKEVTD